jgi:hypothetical protein
MGRGRKSYDAAWAWRIVYHTLRTVVVAYTGALAPAAVATATLPPGEVKRRMDAENMPVGVDYVRACMERFYAHGDPWRTMDSQRRDGRRANSQQRRWIKKKLRRDPTLFFDEVNEKFLGKFGRSISDKMISQAIHFDGDHRLDRPLSLKTLQVLARQRNEGKRLECRLGLAGLEAECMIILDESHIADRDFRRRRGWAPVGEPSLVYEYFSHDNRLRSVLAAVNKDGFVTEACQVRKLSPWGVSPPPPSPQLTHLLLSPSRLGRGQLLPGSGESCVYLDPRPDLWRLVAGRGGGRR